MIFDLWIGFILLVILRLVTGATYSPTTVGFGGGKSTTTTVQKVEAATPQDLALKQIDLEFSELNLASFRQEQAIQDFLLLGKELPPSTFGFQAPRDFQPINIRSVVPGQTSTADLQGLISGIPQGAGVPQNLIDTLQGTVTSSERFIQAAGPVNAAIQQANIRQQEQFQANLPRTPEGELDLGPIPPQLQGLQDILQGELDLIGPRGELASLEVQAARRQLEDIAPLQSELAQLELQTAKQRIPIEQEILEEQLASILRGGLPSEEVFAEIDKLLAETRGIGTEAIDKSIKNAIRQVVEEVAPSRGLRPTDSPILADLERIGEEGVRQKGLLERELVRGRSQLALGQGLQIGQLSQAITAPSLARTATSTGFSGAFPSSFGLTQNATAPTLGTVSGVRGVTTANLAPTFGPQFFVTGRTDSRTTAPGIGRSLAVATIGAIGTAAAGLLSRPA